MHRTFPKENQKKLNETIKELRALLKQKEKQIRFLEEELENLLKPVRTRKKEVKLEPGSDEWRMDFVKRLKKEVFGD